MPKTEKLIIILCAEKSAHLELADTLERSGFSPLIIDQNNLDTAKHIVLPPKAIILDTRKIGINPEILRYIKGKFPNIDPPILALMESLPAVDNKNFSSVLIAPFPPAQIAIRISSLIRLSEMQTEISLRLHTLEQDFGIIINKQIDETSEPFNILFIGKAMPEFMIVINALQEKNVNVVAAFTSFTAFDYLYEKDFDAVVICGLNDMELAFSIAQTMRKNAKLFHIPALLLVDGANFDYNSNAYKAGFDDIIDAKSETEELRGRILERANFYRLHNNLKEEFGALGGDICTDHLTSLYNKTFFNKHLVRLNRYYKALAQPISLCLVRVLPNSENIDISASYAQIGSLLKSLVRVQDLTARIETNLFAILFAGQSADELQPVYERIDSILKCATLTNPQTGEALNIRLEIKLTDLTRPLKTDQTSVA